MSIKMREKRISNNKNYSFHFMKKHCLKSKNEFFVHVTNANHVAVQIRNIFSKFFVILKNFKIDYFRNYVEKKRYFVNSKNYHLTVILSKINFKFYF